VTTYISMLRGINVGGKTIKMADLKVLYEFLGFSDVTTYVQSGNLIFKTKKENTAAVVGSIERAIVEQLGLKVTVIVRQPVEMALIIKKNPFVGRRAVDENKLHVTFLQEKPASALVEALIPLASTSKDEYRVEGKEVYLHCPKSYGETLLSNKFFEKNLKVAATTRNWRTVNVLYSMSIQ